MINYFRWKNKIKVQKVHKLLSIKRLKCCVNLTIFWIVKTVPRVFLLSHFKGKKTPAKCGII